jgi:hypothetical protein
MNVLEEHVASIFRVLFCRNLLPISSGTPKMKATGFQMLIPVYKTRWPHIQKTEILIFSAVRTSNVSAEGY